MIVQEDVPYTKEEVKAMVKTIHDLREKASQLGWHPASELPVIPEGDDEVEIYCLVHGKGLTVLVPMKLHYTVSRGFGVSENIEIKWWCYLPKED